MNLGKKFIFASIAIICASITTIILNFSGEIYLKLVVSIVGIFITSQAIVDHKQKKEV